MSRPITHTLRHCSRQLALGLALAAGLSPVAAADADPVVLSFSTVGDSRSDPSLAATRQDKIWLQNTRALSRILREIQAQKPQALFFNGDMIMGYTLDRSVMERQYAYWRGMAAHLMETGTYVVPVPGNHEMQEKATDSAGRTTKIARAFNEDLWRANMGDLILDTERWKNVTGGAASAFDPANAPGAADGLQSSQSQLSYSFDAGNSHFVVINTDPVGNDGHAPLRWLEDDFAKAKARGAMRFFVFGHKPAYTYAYKPGVEADGFDADPEHARAFWSLVERYNAAYFCGHQHIYNAAQPARATGGKAWQVILGSGGSPFSAKKADANHPTDRMYAWATVQVHASGKAHLEVYGFDDQYGQTRVLNSFDF